MEFAVAVYRLCRGLPGTDEGRHVANQLRRAASSVAANYRAACRGRSDRELISKLGTCIEEGDESGFWLDFIARIELATPYGGSKPSAFILQPSAFPGSS
ncbi:MAG: four helix bundle protein [Acidobacteria bacterium]|nr:four helix bundle protein [Acidobacteriota bacterium]